jgi:hypothetical protein
VKPQSLSRIRRRISSQKWFINPGA